MAYQNYSDLYQHTRVLLQQDNQTFNDEEARAIHQQLGQDLTTKILPLLKVKVQMTYLQLRQGISLHANNIYKVSAVFDNEGSLLHTAPSREDFRRYGFTDRVAPIVITTGDFLEVFDAEAQRDTNRRDDEIYTIDAYMIYQMDFATDDLIKRNEGLMLKGMLYYTSMFQRAGQADLAIRLADYKAELAEAKKTQIRMIDTLPNPYGNAGGY